MTTSSWHPAIEPLQDLVDNEKATAAPRIKLDYPAGGSDTELPDDPNPALSQRPEDPASHGTLFTSVTFKGMRSFSRCYYIGSEHHVILQRRWSRDEPGEGTVDSGLFFQLYRYDGEVWRGLDADGDYTAEVSVQLGADEAVTLVRNMSSVLQLE